jgi:hypothetical protein
MPNCDREIAICSIPDNLENVGGEAVLPLG